MDTNTALEAFLRHLRLERGLSERSDETYGNRLKDFLRMLDAKGIQLEAANREDVIAYLAALKERGLQAPSILCAAAAIRAFYQYLLDRGAVAADPSTKLRLPKIAAHLPEPLTVEEVERLLAAPSNRRFSGVRDRAILDLLYCGLRLGEALGLDVDQMHADEAYVKVRGKGDKDRVVPASRMAVEAIQRYLEARSDKFGSVAGPLFLSQGGGRLTHSGFWRRFKTYAKRAGLAPSAHPHTLRHSFCLHMLAGRADLRSIQLLCGHASLATTQKYLNLDLVALKNACQMAHPRF